MPAELSERAEELLAELPPLLQNAYALQAALAALAGEFDRYQAEVDELLAGFFPQSADDYLKLWENLLGLSVEAPDKTLAQRRETALAFFSSLAGVGSATTWVEILTRLIGSGWTYEEHEPVQFRRTNLVKRPSAEVDTTGWSVTGTGLSGVALTRVADATVESGGFAFELTGTQPADTTARSVEMIQSSGTANYQPVTPGRRYLLAATVDTVDASASTAHGARLRVYWYDSGGVALAAPHSETLTNYRPGGAEFDQRFVNVFQAPPGAAYARVAITSATNVSGDVMTLRIDGVMFRDVTDDESWTPVLSDTAFDGSVSYETTGTLNLTGGAAVGTADAAAELRPSQVATNGSDQRATLTFTTGTDLTSWSVDLRLRRQDGNNYLGATLTNGVLVVRKVVAGSGTNLATEATVSLSASTTYAVEFILVGHVAVANLWQGAVGGTLVCTVSADLARDPTLAAALLDGPGGMSMSLNPPATFTGWQIDAWALEAAEFEYDDSYFDGSVAGYEWAGTAHDSISYPTFPDAHTLLVTLPYSEPVADPVAAPSVTPSGGGGTTYFWAYTALTVYGETRASPAASTNLPGGGSVAVNWADVPGATGYRVYRGTTSGNLRRIAETATSDYTDNEDPAGSIPPPEANLSGSPLAYEAEQLARQITPAHIDLIFGYGEGFILGVSRLSEEPL